MAVLDQHGVYTEDGLSEYMRHFYPEIPQDMRRVIAIAAATGAQHASALHNVIMQNRESRDEHKRQFAADAASSMSFWALGLRPAYRSGSVFGKGQPPTTAVQPQGGPEDRCSGDAPRVPINNHQVSDILTSRLLPVPLPHQDDELSEMLAADAADNLMSANLTFLTAGPDTVELPSDGTLAPKMMSAVTMESISGTLQQMQYANQPTTAVARTLTVPGQENDVSDTRTVMITDMISSVVASDGSGDYDSRDGTTSKATAEPTAVSVPEPAPTATCSNATSEDVPTGGDMVESSTESHVKSKPSAAPEAVAESAGTAQSAKPSASRAVDKSTVNEPGIVLKLRPSPDPELDADVVPGRSKTKSDSAKPAPAKSTTKSSAEDAKGSKERSVSSPKKRSNDHKDDDVRGSPTKRGRSPDRRGKSRQSPRRGVSRRSPSPRKTSKTITLSADEYAKLLRNSRP